MLLIISYTLMLSNVSKYITLNASLDKLIQNKYFHTFTLPTNIYVFIINKNQMKLLTSFLYKAFSQPLKLKPLTAYKYIRSISETALLYKPLNLRYLNATQNLADRVVQAFFDSSKVQIKVSEAQGRLKQVKEFSTPAHSFYQISLPFEQNHTMRQKMVQFAHNYIRVGRMLELMDYIAANVAYRYCTPDDQKDLDMNELSFLVVTAAIDSIEFYYPISTEIDCTLSGYVSYVGKSSMEVHIDVLQKTGDSERLACSANFVMVARSKINGKAYEVPVMNYNNEKDTFRIIHELGFQRQATRKRENAKALQISPPTYEESVVIHKLRNHLRAHDFNNHVPMATTILKNTMLMHMEDKNLSGKVFGGLILRMGYELGWLCASKFLRIGYPIITHVDDVQFLAPVEIGSYVELEAKVGYVTDRYIHVIITCNNWEIKKEKSVLTNVLRVTFEHGVEPTEIRRVFPETLSESYVYIESMRRVERMTPIDI